MKTRGGLLLAGESFHEREDAVAAFPKAQVPGARAVKRKKRVLSENGSKGKIAHLCR
jgi:hypothetical protein